MVVEVIKGVLDQYLLNPAGLWALLALVPLIIVYLIRPRPKKQTVPALMFLIKERARSDKTSFLKNMVKDPLLLFQILVLIAFAAAIAKPFITVTEDVFVEKTALVVDVSASSQVEIDGSSRFERIVELAKENMGSSNALILMSSVPEFVADDADAAKTRSLLNDLKPKDTPTNIFDSIVFASNYVNEKDRVVVISDFIETATEKDFKAARDILESKGVIVDLIDVREQESRPAFNIGIIGVDVAEDKTTIQIKNYNSRNETIGIRMEGANLTIPEFTIAPNDVEVVTFPTPARTAKFWLVPYSGDDDFELDNTAYLAAPSDDPISVLVMSNSISRHLSTALDVINTIAVERSMPPQIPEFGHQIIMYNNVKSDLMLPSTMKKVKKKVEEGAALIVVAQEGLLRTDFMGMLPVEPSESDASMKKEEVYIYPVTESSITEDMNFGKVTQYMDVKAKEGAIVIAAAPDNTPIIAMRSLEKGTVVFFGLMDNYADFKSDIYYPVFWKRLFEMLAKKQDLSEMNFRTGRLVNLLEEQAVEAPFGKITTDTIVLTKQGIYTGKEKSFAANLASEAESDINGVSAGEKIGVFEDTAKTQELIPFEMTRYLIIALLALVFLELIWIKFRGDL